MKLPQLVKATDIMHTRTVELWPNDHWVPMRGIRPTWICLRRRIKLAWMVFTGKADAVTWDA